MTRMLRTLAFLLFLQPLVGCAASTQHSVAPLHLWNHKLVIPTENIEKLALGPESLHVNYADGVKLSAMVMTFDSLSLPVGMTGPTFMAQVYGRDEPEIEMLATIRRIIFEDVREHYEKETTEGLNVYWLGYDDRVSAYVVDDRNDRLFLLLEGTGSVLEQVVNTITRR